MASPGRSRPQRGRNIACPYIRGYPPNLGEQMTHICGRKRRIRKTPRKIKKKNLHFLLLLRRVHINMVTLNLKNKSEDSCSNA